MYEREVDGELFKRMMNCGLAELKANIAEINDLNVFPIPDGDTGDNMYSTLSGGVKALRGLEVSALGEAASRAGSGMLMSARGNSGVILSQMFAGIAKGLEGTERADVSAFGRAFGEGVRFAYASVAEPVEGTMLTVMKDAAAYASGRIDSRSTPESFLEDYVRETELSLGRTPELLPILKNSGVIDSGGAGVFHIARGFLKAVRGEEVFSVEEEGSAAVLSEEPQFALFNEDSVMEFGYCTEFLLQLTRAKTDVEAFSLDDFRAWLTAAGDSVAVVRTGTVVKVHVHTMKPGEILQYAQTYGEFLTLKIENMTLQHNGRSERRQNREELRKNPQRKHFGVVAVADGEGISAAFRELGADIVLEGGPGRNPSVELFLKAFEAVNADCIFVLPDNSNIRMAATEAASLYQTSEVRVLPTKNVGEGYAALSALDCASGDAESVFKNMAAEVSRSASGTVARATRSVLLDSVEVREGDYIGFVGKKMFVSGTDKVRTALALTEELGAALREFIIVFYGRDVTESERHAYRRGVSEKFPAAEFYETDGGQSVYDFVLVLQ